MFVKGDRVKLTEAYFRSRPDLIDRWKDHTFKVEACGQMDVLTTCGHSFRVKYLEYAEAPDPVEVLLLPKPPVATNLDSLTSCDPELLPTEVFTVEDVASYVERVNLAFQEANQKVTALKQYQALPVRPIAPPMDREVVFKQGWNEAVDAIYEHFMSTHRKVSASQARRFRKP